jgi:hypothetical protein
MPLRPGALISAEIRTLPAATRGDELGIQNRSICALAVASGIEAEPYIATATRESLRLGQPLVGLCLNPAVRAEVASRRHLGNLMLSCLVAFGMQLFELAFARRARPTDEAVAVERDDQLERHFIGHALPPSVVLPASA